jgi:hypothetical protein
MIGGDAAVVTASCRAYVTATAATVATTALATLAAWGRALQPCILGDVIHYSYVEPRPLVPGQES